mgnify:CR=1 FL=1
MAESYYRFERVGDLPPKLFMTDGCTLFLERFGSKNWSPACLNHDIAYWAGGTKEDRLQADNKFKQEINSLIPGLGSVMAFAVGLAGSPYLPTWWRFGYGWPYGHGYK